MDEGDNALRDFQTASSTLPIISEQGSQPQESSQDSHLEQQDSQPQQIEEPKPDWTIPEPPKPKAETKKTVEVTVKKGVSLDKIAKANGTTIKAIKSANDLKTDRLDIGQVLRVPVGAKKAKADKPVAKADKATKKADKAATKEIAENKPASTSDTEFYTIKTGDNPWEIAKKFNIKVSDFLKLNNLDEEKTRNLKVGEKVRVK